MSQRAHTRESFVGAMNEACAAEICDRLEVIARYLEDIRNGPHAQTAEGYQNRANYGAPTHEDTLMWGDSTDSLTFNSTEAVTFPLQASQMLVHAARSRPTAWQVTFTAKLGAGWTGENNGWELILQLTLGVGKSQSVFQKVYSLGATPTNGTIVVSDTFAVAAQAMQGTVFLNDGGGVTLTGLHGVQVSLAAAPFVQ